MRRGGTYGRRVRRRHAEADTDARQDVITSYSIHYTKLYDDSGLAAGRPAPAFTAIAANGETVSLADFKGRTVVLEWTNDGCPFVRKHYARPPGNMQGLQAAAAADDAVWRNNFV